MDLLVKSGKLPAIVISKLAQRASLRRSIRKRDLGSSELERHCKSTEIFGCSIKGNETEAMREHVPLSQNPSRFSKQRHNRYLLRYRLLIKYVLLYELLGKRRYLVCIAAEGIW